MVAANPPALKSAGRPNASFKPAFATYPAPAATLCVTHAEAPKPSANSPAPHVTAAGDTDVAGTLSVPPAAGVASPGPAVGTAQDNFIKPYASAPVVVVTAAGNPLQGAQVPAVWVTLNINSSNQYTGFILHYQVPSTTATPSTVTYNYHVIGS